MSIIRLVLISMLCVASACGEGLVPAPAPKMPDFNPDLAELAGEWTGSETVAMDDTPVLHRLVSMRLVYAGNTLSIEGVCPDGTGQLGISGSRGTHEWATEMVCPFQEASCTSAIVRYTAVSVEPGERSVTLLLTGTYVGADCGEYIRPVSAVFVLSRT